VGRIHDGRSLFECQRRHAARRLGSNSAAGSRACMNDCVHRCGHAGYHPDGNYRASGQPSHHLWIGSHVPCVIILLPQRSGSLATSPSGRGVQCCRWFAVYLVFQY
jgi:hypothetical protein